MSGKLILPKLIISLGNLWSATVLVVAMFITATLAIASHAAEIATIDLYTSEHAMDSRASSERRKVLSSALEQVLIKASGRQDILSQYPVLRDKVRNAASLVQSYSYRESSAKISEDKQRALLDSLADSAESGTDQDVESADGWSKRHSKKQLWLSLAFNENTVIQMLRQAGAPVWQAQRPKVLLELHGVPLAGSGVGAGADKLRQEAVQSWITALAAKRGLAIDIEYLNAQAGTQKKRDTFGSSLTGNASPISTTPQAGKYHWVVQATLNTKYRSYSGPQHAFEWSLLQQQRSRFELVSRAQSEPVSSSRPFSARLTQLVNRVADHLGEYYALGTGTSMGIDGINQFTSELLVSGIYSKTDYLSLQSLISKTKGLEGIRLIEVEGSSLRYRLPVGASTEKISSLLTLSGRLEVNQNSPSELYWIDRNSR